MTALLHLTLPRGLLLLLCLLFDALLQGQDESVEWPLVKSHQIQLRHRLDARRARFVGEERALSKKVGFAQLGNLSTGAGEDGLYDKAGSALAHWSRGAIARLGGGQCVWCMAPL